MPGRDRGEDVTGGESTSGRAAVQDRSTTGWTGDRPERRADGLARAQSAVGNRAVARLAERGSAADATAAERAADRLASADPDRPPAGRTAAGGPGARPSLDPLDGSGLARRSGAPLGDVPAPDSALERRIVREKVAAVVRRGDRALRSGLASHLAGRLGVGVDGLRVSTGSAAADLSRRLHARAVAVGDRLVFDRGAFQPGTDRGRDLLAHEAAHSLQQARAGVAAVQRKSHASRITEKLGFLRSRSAAVEAMDVLAGLSASDFDDTVADLAASGEISALLHKVGTRDQVLRFAHLLAERGSAPTKTAVFKAAPMLRLDVESQLIVFGRQYVSDFGPSGRLSASRRQSLQSSVVPSDPAAPFSGMSPRGERPSEAPMGWGEFLGFGTQYLYGKATGADLDRAKYQRTWGLGMIHEWSNPIKGWLYGSPPSGTSYLGGLSATQRQQQAELLFGQEIATAFPAAYGGKEPTRIQVIRAAAKAHDLEPELVAGIILAEQRDQSKKEDAADYQAATVAGKSTSIGLGQVTVATARKGDLFQDLLGPTMGGKRAITIPRLLASDEFNIFAVARYAREVANTGATTTLASLPGLHGQFAGLSMSVFAQHSSTWTDDHIQVLGSEYTSAPFQRPHSIPWGGFVLRAYEDVKAAGIF